MMNINYDAYEVISIMLEDQKKKEIPVCLVAFKWPGYHIQVANWKM